MLKTTLAVKNENYTNETIIFQEQVIKVKTRLSVEDIVKLVSIYISEYFSNSDQENYSPYSEVVQAEYALKSTTFELATDKTVGENDFGLIADAGLFDEVISKISNFKFVIELINKTIEKIEKENSFENQLVLLVNKASAVLDKIEGMGFDKEMVSTIQTIVSDIKGIDEQKEMPIKRKKSKGKVS